MTSHPLSPDYRNAAEMFGEVHHYVWVSLHMSQKSKWEYPANRNELHERVEICYTRQLLTYRKIHVSSKFTSFILQKNTCFIKIYFFIVPLILRVAFSVSSAHIYGCFMLCRIYVLGKNTLIIFTRYSWPATKYSQCELNLIYSHNFQDLNWAEIAFLLCIPINFCIRDNMKSKFGMKNESF